MTARAPPAGAEGPRFYGRRHGHRLRKGRQALLETLLPKLRVPLPAGGALLDPKTLFSTPPADVWLEVGFGAGEHLAEQARAHPEVGIIGCEPFVNGVASLLSRIERQRLANVRVFDGDARLLLPALAEASLGRVFVLFSDPWPKKRHHRRRFISEATLELLARLLKDGGELRFATDDPGYARSTLDQATRRPEFAWPATTKRDWSEAPADGFATRYEAKAGQHGRAPVYLRFLRRPRR